MLTTSLAIASVLYAQEGVSLTILGGGVRPNSPDLIGPLTEENLRRFRPDLAIVGADAACEDGLYTATLEVARITGAMLEQSRETWLVADSTKFARRSFVRFAGWGSVQHVVTDSALSPQARDGCGRAGPRPISSKSESRERRLPACKGEEDDDHDPPSRPHRRRPDGQGDLLRAPRWCHISVPSVQPALTAICDTNPTVREWFTDHVPGLSLATADYHELLASADVDAVYSAVPHNLHEAIYTDILKAGKHLFGEKPFGIDAAANAAIVAEAAVHPKLVVRCSSQYPFFPASQRLVRDAGEGAFGTILEVEAGFLHSSDMDPTKPKNWKRDIAVNGAYGCLGDLGMHVLHLPLRLGWEPRNVRAILSNVIRERPGPTARCWPTETWDNATLLCEVEGGDGPFPLTLKTQRMAPGEMNTWYVTIKGTALSAHFTTKHPRTLLTMPYRRGEAQAWHHEDLGYQSVYPAVTGGIFEFGFPDAIQQMLAAFCDQVAQGPRAELPFGCATLEETRRHHAVLTAALESQASGQVISISEGKR